MTEMSLSHEEQPVVLDPSISRERLAIYCGPFDGGSTAKIAARLANGFVARGVATDLLVTASRDPIPEATAPQVRLIDMGHMNALSRVPAMAIYLRRRRPAAILTHRIRENVLTLKAARLAGTRTPVFVTVHGRMSVKLEHLKGWKSARRRAQVLRYYRRNQGIVAISDDTADDLRTLLGANVPVTTIANPIVTSEMLELSHAPIDHPWLSADGAVPVLVFAGRMEGEKDLFTLLHAFARLRRRIDCRLLLIGDGRLRSAIEAERAALGLADVVDMPGWMHNPYPYLRRAGLVVLSSTWDALPTVLIEALACGTPVVSTDCGAGPREILDGGRLGPLVPPGDPQALADAMAHALFNAPSAEILRRGSERYEAQRNADRYLQWMLRRDGGHGD